MLVRPRLLRTRDQTVLAGPSGCGRTLPRLGNCVFTSRGWCDAQLN